MGYAIEFYSLDWPRLGSAFGSGNAAILPTLAARRTQLMAGDPGRGTNWAHALEDFIHGRSGPVRRDGSPGPAPRRVTPDEAVAIAFLVRLAGRRIGEVQHSTRGGRAFRNLLERGALTTVLPQLPWTRHILRRPLCGLVSDDYPTWGGLTRRELAQLQQTGKLSPPLALSDPDEASWACDLLLALDDAAQAGQDLVTLYL